MADTGDRHLAIVRAIYEMHRAEISGGVRHAHTGWSHLEAQRPDGMKLTYTIPAGR
jgi:hypothetical protein